MGKSSLLPSNLSFSTITRFGLFSLFRQLCLMGPSVTSIRFNWLNGQPAQQVDGLGKKLLLDSFGYLLGGVFGFEGDSHHSFIVQPGFEPYNPKR